MSRAPRWSLLPSKAFTGGGLPGEAAATALVGLGVHVAGNLEANDAAAGQGKN